MVNKSGSRKKKSKKQRSESGLGVPVIRRNVAGVDVGSTEHWVCGPATTDGKPNVRVFGTITSQLEALADWLEELDVESVAMESTYIYWIPLYELLEFARSSP